MKKFFFAPLFFALILSACGAPPTPAPSSTPSATPPPTATFTPEPTSTPTPEPYIQIINADALGAIESVVGKGNVGEYLFSDEAGKLYVSLVDGSRVEVDRNTFKLHKGQTNIPQEFRGDHNGIVTAQGVGENEGKTYFFNPGIEKNEEIGEEGVETVWQEMIDLSSAVTAQKGTQEFRDHWKNQFKVPVDLENGVEDVTSGRAFWSMWLQGLIKSVPESVINNENMLGVKLGYIREGDVGNGIGGHEITFISSDYMEPSGAVFRFNVDGENIYLLPINYWNRAVLEDKDPGEVSVAFAVVGNERVESYKHGGGDLDHWIDRIIARDLKFWFIIDSDQEAPLSDVVSYSGPVTPSLQVLTDKYPGIMIPENLLRNPVVIEMIDLIMNSYEDGNVGWFNDKIPSLDRSLVAYYVQQ